MKIINCDWDEFQVEVKHKSIYCFGSGAVSILYLDLLRSKGMCEQIEAFVDNSFHKIGKSKDYQDKQYKIISVDEMVRIIRDGVVLITCSDIVGVINQLNEICELNHVMCYIMSLLLSNQFYKSAYIGNLRINEDMRIPKKIHYCWFGKNPIPEKNLACIETWKKYCPDYDIIEWNEENYDYTKIRYMYEAYVNRKWGFVPDYARLDIIYNYGGIYLDVDVEMIRNIDDLLYQDAFAGFDAQIHINLGSGFGAISHHGMIKEFRDYYDDKPFVDIKGNCDLTPCLAYQQAVLEKHNFILDDKFQIINGMSIFPAIVMNGIDINAFVERREACTCFLHHADGSWQTEELKQAKKYRMTYIKSVCKSDI